MEMEVSDTHKRCLKRQNPANELIKEKVSIEMEHLTSPEAELSYGVTETSEDRIKSNIQSFEIEGGPARRHFLIMIFIDYRLLLNMFGQNYLIKKY